MQFPRISVFVVLVVLAALPSAVPTAQADLTGSVFTTNYDNDAIQGVTGSSVYTGVFGGPIASAPLGLYHGTDVYAEILGGITPGSLTPLQKLPGLAASASRNSDVEADGPLGNGGFFDAGYGYVDGSVEHGTAYFQIVAWSSTTDYVTALATTGAWAGATAIWGPQALGTHGNVGEPPAVPQPTYLLVPGPTILYQTTLPGDANRDSKVDINDLTGS